MSNLYQRLATHPWGKRALRTLGLPTPVPLRRWQASSGQDKNQAICASIEPASVLAGLPVTVLSESVDKTHSLIFDATAISQPQQLTQLYTFFHQHISQLATHGRIILFARPVAEAKHAEQASAIQALDGFTRSLAKEVGRKAATAQLVYVSSGAEEQVGNTTEFLLSRKSAYISGQSITLTHAPQQAETQRKPLANKVALVTGASRGIGAEIVATLARDGAKVIGLDIPALAAELNHTMASVDGTALIADITDANALTAILQQATEHQGLDILVHNAGVTRDKTIARMQTGQWQQTLDINLLAIQKIDQALLNAKLINTHGRIVCISSMNGIAGQAGQTNYAASKAGIIGYVHHLSQSPQLQQRGITLNAVAPGFIETEMTKALPMASRIVGRHINALSQAGTPQDVAETIGFFAAPGSAGVNSQVLRVCGLCMIGA